MFEEFPSTPRASAVRRCFVFYYFWGRLAPRDHIIVDWIYGIAAWVSLVLITGITVFMLTTGDWLPDKSFLPRSSTRPSCRRCCYAPVVRSPSPRWALRCICRSRRTLPVEGLDRSLDRWALAGILLIFAGGLWYLLVMPEHAQLNSMRAILLGMTAVNLLVMVALVWGHFTGSRRITPPPAILLLGAGAAANTTGEFVREGTRKPYRIDQYIFAPGVRSSAVKDSQRSGIIRHAPWLQYYLDRHSSPCFSKSKSSG